MHPRGVISRVMKVQKLYRKQLINATLSEVWDFFSHADNLARLTPAYMQMKVTSGDLPAEVYPGQIITYTLKPLLRISVSWMTEITHIIPGRLFVDEQRSGPYRIWHHEHHFEEQDGKVLMTDIVHYQLPFSFLGSFAHFLFIKRQLDGIFEYRQRQIETIFK